MANQISLEDFNMTMATQQKVLFTNPEFLSALMGFWIRFEAVFGEADWEMTRDVLTCDMLEHYIHPNGTFLEPGVEDESNNWGNRGSLLSSYRILKRQLELHQFIVTEIHPCGRVTRCATQQSKADVAANDDSGEI